MTLIHITATLEDGQEITRFVQVKSAASPLWWSEGIRNAAPQAVEEIAQMVEAIYGKPAASALNLRRTPREQLGELGEPEAK